MTSKSKAYEEFNIPYAVTIAKRKMVGPGSHVFSPQITDCFHLPMCLVQFSPRTDLSIVE